MKEATIYLITNKVNGNRYVGLTRYSIEKRWGEHKAGARARRTKSALYAAIRKYGEAEFRLEEVASCLSLDTATAVEKAVIQALKPEYNLTNGGEFTVGKRVLSQKAKDSIGRADAGKTITAAQKKQISETLKTRYAANSAYREKVLADLAMGRAGIDRDKQRAAASAFAKTRVWSEESRRRLSNARKGIRHSKEVTERIAATKRKSVECVTLATVFDSMSEAAEMTGLSVSAVSDVCRGRYSSAAGLVFKFNSEDLHKLPTLRP